MKKKDIVKESNDFNNIIKKGHKLYNRSFAIYYRKNDYSKNRFGVSVGIKLGNAVFRNKYKRKIRMIITTNMSKLKFNGYDCIIILRKTGSFLTYQQLENEYLELINKLKEN